jgi:hypothetical protein
MPSITEKDVLEAVCEFMKKRSRASFTPKDVLEVLLNSGKINITDLENTEKVLTRIFSSMARRGVFKVEKKGTYKITDVFWSEAQNKNIECYKGILAYLSRNIKVETLSDIQDKIIGLEEGRLTLPEFLADLITLDKERREIIYHAVDELISENPDPKKIFIDMLKDYVQVYDRLVEKISKTSAGKEREEIITFAKKLLDIIKNIYGRVLSLPISYTKNCTVCPIILPKDPGRGKIEIREDILEGLLKERIVDDTFFVEEPVSAPVAAFAGVDTSVVEIDLKKGPFEYMRHLPDIDVFTMVVSVREGRTGNNKEEIYPRPEEITTKTLKELEKERDILPADVIYKFDDYYIPHIKETIMQSKEYRAVYSLPDRKPSLLIIYKDGALWPSERKFDDFLYDHREFVIDNLIEYSKMVKNLSETPVVVGVVKRGHLGFLWFLLNWYIIRKMNKTDVRELSKFVAFLERQISSDGSLALLMLLRYAEKRGLDNKGVRMFAVRRKFYATDSQLIDTLLKYAERKGKSAAELERDENTWKEIVWCLLMNRDRISKGDELKRFLNGETDALESEEYARDLKEILEKHGLNDTGISSPPDCCRIYESLIEEGREDILLGLLSEYSKKVYRELPFIISYADTVFFYYLPPYKVVSKLKTLIENKSSSFSLPRFEIQINGSNTHSASNASIKRTISRISVLPFEDFYVYYGPEEYVNRAMVLPVPVKDAHYYAKYIAREIKPAFLRVLLDAVMKYLSESDAGET